MVTSDIPTKFSLLSAKQHRNPRLVNYIIVLSGHFLKACQMGLRNVADRMRRSIHKSHPDLRARCTRPAPPTLIKERAPNHPCLPLKVQHTLLFSSNNCFTEVYWFK